MFDVIGQFDEECKLTNSPTSVSSTTTTTQLYNGGTPNDLPYSDIEAQYPTIVAVACAVSTLITVILFTIYVYKNQVQRNCKRASYQVKRISSNMAPHYAQYFRGPLAERISIVDN